jgi:hypothetical protein
VTRTVHEVAQMFATGDRSLYEREIESMSMVGERSIIEMVAHLPVKPAAAFTITLHEHDKPMTVIVVEED